MAGGVKNDRLVAAIKAISVRMVLPPSRSISLGLIASNLLRTAQRRSQVDCRPRAGTTLYLLPGGFATLHTSSSVCMFMRMCDLPSPILWIGSMFQAGQIRGLTPLHG